jgi:outer membrane protein assembly factor BamA
MTRKPPSGVSPRKARLKTAKKRIATAFLIGFCLLSLFRLWAASAVSFEEEATKKEKTSGLTFLPVIFYTPETKWALGGGGLFYFRATKDKDVSRPANIKFIAVYTQRKQTNFELNPDFYLAKGYHVQANIQYSDFPDQFYGIGSGTTGDMKEPFTSKFWKLSVEALKKIHGPLNAGFQYFFDDTKLTEVEDGGLLESPNTPGSSGGTASGLGCLMTYDSRDSIFYPTAGSFHQFSVTAFGRALGSDFTYNRFYLELRKYFRFSYAHCLALQTRFLFQAGDPPFWRLGLLGGAESMRGYYLGRYRDKNMVVLQAEYRWAPIFWRLGLAAFAALGDVAATLGRFDLGQFKYTYGLGLRFVIDPKQRLHLRLDFGFGKETSGVYFTASEAF